jgi:hypothetical protein
VDGATSYCGDGQVDPNSEQCDGSWDCTAECTRCPNPPAVDQVLTACVSPPVTQCADAFILYQGQSAAQSFTVGASGALTAVRLRGRSNLDERNPLLVAVVDAAGNQDALLVREFDIASQTVASALTSWGPTMDWYEVTFAVPPIVSAGQILYLVVRLIGDSPPPCPTGCWDSDLDMCMCDLFAHWGMYNYWQGAMLDSYPGGYAFSCGGTCESWSREPPYRDHEFETVVTPLCP